MWRTDALHAEKATTGKRIMIKIKRTIDKEALNELPKAAFPGQIHVVQTPQEAERAATYLKTCPIVGIDTETRPSFSKGRTYKVALLQVSFGEKVVALVPFVIPCSMAHATDSAHQLPEGTSVKMGTVDDDSSTARAGVAGIVNNIAENKTTIRFRTLFIPKHLFFKFGFNNSTVM